MKCPGQDMKYWKEDAIYEINCPKCDIAVEFYKDDTTRKCHQCGHRFVNPKLDFGCATYCQFAEQCIGTLPEDYVPQQDSLLKDRVAVEVKKFFKTDFKRIGLTTRIARFAETLAKETKGADMPLILCSSYLFLVGYPEASKQSQHMELRDIQRYGPAKAREILIHLQADKNLIDEVCCVINGGEAKNSSHALANSILNDAYTLALLDIAASDNTVKISGNVPKIDDLQTKKARALAAELVFKLT